MLVFVYFQSSKYRKSILHASDAASTAPVSWSAKRKSNSNKRVGFVDVTAGDGNEDDNGADDDVVMNTAPGEYASVLEQVLHSS